MVNKKIWAIAMLFVIALGSVSLYAQPREVNVARPINQTLKGGEATITLNSNGTMSLYVNYQNYRGTYKFVSGGPADGLLELYETDGTRVGAYPFKWRQKPIKIDWVDIQGTRMR